MDIIVQQTLISSNQKIEVDIPLKKNSMRGQLVYELVADFFYLGFLRKKLVHCSESREINLSAKTKKPKSTYYFTSLDIYLTLCYTKSTYYFTSLDINLTLCYTKSTYYFTSLDIYLTLCYTKSMYYFTSLDINLTLCQVYILLYFFRYKLDTLPNLHITLLLQIYT